MNDTQLDALVASTAPVTDDAVGTADLATAELADALLMSASGSSGRSGPRFGRRLLATGAAVLIAVGAVVALSVADGDDAQWAAASMRVAQAAPRLLMQTPDWTIEHVNELTADKGEVTFSDGASELKVRWVPASEHDSRVEDRAASSGMRTTATVEGRSVDVFRYDGDGAFTALWTDGESSVEARSSVDSFETFEAILDSLQSVEPEAWLAAMPTSAVMPAGRDAAIAQMLRDVRLPPGFSVDAIPDRGGVTDRYQLGAAVTGTVACQWIEIWDDAVQAGDAETVNAAVAAMNDSRDWDVLAEMNQTGDWPEAVWEFADAMAGVGEVRTGVPMSVVAASTTLGCQNVS